MGDGARRREDARERIGIGDGGAYGLIGPGGAGDLCDDGDVCARTIERIRRIDQIDVLDIIEGPVEQRCGGVESAFFGRTAEHDGVDAVFRALAGAGEAVEGDVARAGLHADHPVVDAEELVGRDERDRALGPVFLRDGDGDVSPADDRAERVVLHGIRGHLRDVVRGRMRIALVAVGIEPMRIREQGVGAADLRRPGVHRIDEGPFRIGLGIGHETRAHGFGDGDGRIVSRGDEQALKRRLERHRVAGPQLGGRTDRRARLVAHGDRVGERCVIERDDRGHDLGDGCDLVFGIGVAREELAPVVGDGKGRLGIDVGGIVDGKPPARFGGAEDEVGRRAHIGPGRRCDADRKNEGGDDAKHATAHRWAVAERTRDHSEPPAEGPSGRSCASAWGRTRHWRCARTLFRRRPSPHGG